MPPPFVTRREPHVSIVTSAHPYGGAALEEPFSPHEAPEPIRQGATPSRAARMPHAWFKVPTLWKESGGWQEDRFVSVKRRRFLSAAVAFIPQGSELRSWTRSDPRKPTSRNLPK